MRQERAGEPLEGNVMDIKPCLAATPDYVLKARMRTDPEALAELIKRGLVNDPATVRRARVCRDRADDRARRFTR